MAVKPSHPKILRLPLVRTRTGLSRSTIYDQMSRGRFPKQVTLGPKSVGWIEHEIDEWISSRINASRNTTH